MKKIAVSVVAVVAAVIAQATTLYVSPNGTGDGSDWDHAASLATAAAAADATELKLLSGDYTLAEQVTIGSGRNVEIVGGYTGVGETIGSVKSVLRPVQDLRIRHFHITSATVSFRNIGFENGSLPTGASQYGMSVYGKSSFVSFTDCTFVGNGGVFNDNGGNTYSRFGGAIYATGGSLAVTNTVFRGNYIDGYSPGSGTSGYGGAIYTTAASVSLYKCDFDSNHLRHQHFHGFGGAVCVDTSGTAEIAKCTFTSNYFVRAEDYGADRMYGGALYAAGQSSLKIEDCVFVGGWINAVHTTDGLSSAFGHGGSVYLGGNSQNAVVRNVVVSNVGFRAASAYGVGSFTVAGGTARLENVLFSNIRGNALELRGGTLDVFNCTVVGSVDEGRGNGYGLRQAGGTLRSVVNTVFYGNARGDYGYVSGTSSNPFSHCCTQSSKTGEGNFVKDPGFTDVAHGDFSLPWNSVLVEAGTAVEGLDDDIAGGTRPLDADLDGSADYDIGCYEAAVHDTDLDGALATSVSSGKEPLDVTVGVRVYGRNRSGLSYEWVTKRTIGGKTTCTTNLSSEATLALENLAAGVYSFECKITNDQSQSKRVFLDNAVNVLSAYLYVTPEGTGARDGSSWDNAIAGIPAAIAACGSEEMTIRLTDGDYVLADTISLNADARFAMDGGFVGDGEHRTDRKTVVRMADGVRARHFSVEGSKLRFSHLTICGGSLPTGASQYGMSINAKNADLVFDTCEICDNGGVFSDNGNNGYSRYGGAFYLDGGSLVACDTVFSNNYINGSSPGSGTSGYGGAVYTTGASVAMTNVTFDANYVLIKHFYANGGALNLNGAKVVSLVGCTFKGNYVRWQDGYGNDRVYGGTVYASGLSSLLVEDCLFDGGYINSQHPVNGTTSTFGHGGAMFLTGASQAVTVRRSVFRGVGMRDGQRPLYCSGAVTLNGGTLLVENSLFSNGSGNALEIRSGTLTVRNCTIAGLVKTNGDCGYGIMHLGGTLAGMSGSVVWGNEKGVYYYNGVTAGPVTYSCVQDGISGMGNVYIDPLFGDSTYCHLRSQAGRYDGGYFDGGSWVLDATNSPAIDANDKTLSAGAEPQPNRHLLNLGYDAGTETASKSYLGEPAVPTSLAVYLYPLQNVSATSATAVGEAAEAAGGTSTLTIFWGDEDGGTDPDGWDYFAAFADTADWTTVSRTIPAGEGTVYMKMCADDGASTAWSVTRTFRPTLPPTLADCGISHVTRTSFRASGTLASDGGVDTVVRVRYWTTDESQAQIVFYNAGQTVASGTSFTVDITGLAAGTEYHYAIEAVSDAGTAGEPETMNTKSTAPMAVYVTPSGAGIMDGSDWANAYGSIQTAVDVCTCEGDVIYVRSGEYFSAQTVDPADPSHVIVSGRPGLTIRGGYAGEGAPGALAGETVLRRDTDAGLAQYRRLVHALNSTLTLENLIFTNGCLTANEYGYGVRLDTCNTTIRGCRFVKCGRKVDGSGTGYGGGVYAKNGTLAVEDCVFRQNMIHHWGDNSGGYGGGLYAEAVALTVDGCEFDGNWCQNMYQSTHGGGVFVKNGSMVIENTTFRTNYCEKQYHSGSSASYGGNLYVEGTTAPIVRNCSFIGGHCSASFARGGCAYFSIAGKTAVMDRCLVFNTASAPTKTDIQTGSVRIDVGTLLMTNCLVAAVRRGAAVDVGGGTLSAVNCTLADAKTFGVNILANAAVSLRNAIVWGNETDGIGGAYAANLTATYSDIQGATPDSSTHVISTDPKFKGEAASSPLDQNAYHLRSSSPCINAGDATGLPADATDLSGNPRVRSGGLDLGCYEDALRGLLLLVK